MFPDEFHLHTLDQFLSATSRLNPHVNVKAIVIGLMDRLSSYAARESEQEPPDQRLKTEEEAALKLLEELRISKETGTEPAHNGDAASHIESVADSTAPSESTAVEQSENVETESPETAKEDGDVKKNRGIPENVKLFEIFYEQVAALVKMQRLPIQDTIALLVSLTNLAL